MFQLLNAVEQLKTKLETLEPELFELRKEVQRNKAEISYLKNEDQRKKAEILDLKKEDQRMKTENQRVTLLIDALKSQQAHQMSEQKMCLFKISHSKLSVFT